MGLGFQDCTMRWIATELGAVLLWVFASLILAAAGLPWLYRAGYSLAAHAAQYEIAAWLEWLGAACGRANYGRYFDRALLLSAIVTFPLLWWRLRRVASERVVVSEWLGLRAQPWRQGLQQWGVGCFLAVVVLWMVGELAELAGVFEVHATPAFGRLCSRVLVPAIVTPVIEEWLFRGLLLGLWLRFCRPVWAVLGSSLLFATLHFLEPLPDMVIAAPAAPLAGFELLGSIASHFARPSFLLGEVSALLGVGCVLAWVRCRTGSLWMPAGLHAGWIMAFKGFNATHHGVLAHPLSGWGVAVDLRSGLLPLVALAITAAVLPRLPWMRRATSAAAPMSH